MFACAAERKRRLRATYAAFFPRRVGRGAQENEAHGTHARAPAQGWLVGYVGMWTSECIMWFGWSEGMQNLAFMFWGGPTHVFPKRLK